MCTASASPHRPSSVSCRRREQRRCRAASRRRRRWRAARAGGLARLAGCESSVERRHRRLSQQPRDVLEPGDQRPAADRCRRRAPARDARTSARRRPATGAVLPRGSPKARLLSRRNSAPNATRSAEHERDGEQRLAREGRDDDQELAHEDAERRQAGDRDDAEHQAPAEPRMGHRQPADVGDLLRALDLRDMADREEDRRLGQANAWSCAAGRRNWRAVRPCRRRRR